MDIGVTILMAVVGAICVVLYIHNKKIRELVEKAEQANDHLLRIEDKLDQLLEIMNKVMLVKNAEESK